MNNFQERFKNSQRYFLINVSITLRCKFYEGQVFIEKWRIMHTSFLWIGEKIIRKLKIIKILKKVLTTEKKYDIINIVAKGN